MLAKRSLVVIALASALIFTPGCGILLPKKVEFFQDRVHKFPEPSSSAKETQREAAALAARLADDTVVAAVGNDCPTNVVAPAKDTAELARAVSQSLGPPSSPWTGSATNLALKLDKSVASFNAKVEDFKQDNNENAGKKIEGTGLFRIGYFTMWGLIIGAVLLLGLALKIYGIFNPVVGLGTNVVGRVASTVLKRGYTEIIAGGERFKEYLQNSTLTADVKAQVADYFQRAQMESQSQDTQGIVKNLTV